MIAEFNGYVRTKQGQPQGQGDYRDWIAEWEEDEEWEKEQMRELEGFIRTGKIIHTNKEGFPLVRKWLYRIACKFEDQKQHPYKAIAISQLMRLEKEFGVFE